MDVQATPGDAVALVDDARSRRRQVTPPPPEHDDRSTAWQRALTVLEVLGAENTATGMGVVEIARRLGRDKSQMSRMLRGLAAAGYVEREPDSARYRLGPRLFALAAHAIDERLRSEADVLVERESARLGERVEVAVRSGSLGVTISTAAPEVELRTVGWVGRRVPVASSALGRALVFDLHDDAVTRLVVAGGLDGPRVASPRSLDDLLTRLASDRARGWALADETSGGLVAVAAPVRDARRRIVAAVGVSGPRTRMQPVLGDAVDAATRTAADLAAALGDTAAPPVASRVRGPTAVRDDPDPASRSADTTGPDTTPEGLHP